MIAEVQFAFACFLVGQVLVVLGFIHLFRFMKGLNNGNG